MSNREQSESAEALAKEIVRHRKAYYSGSPEISDEYYDRLEDQLRKLSPQHPVLERVGTPPERTGGKKVQHDTKMLSLDKVYELHELKEWSEGQDLVSTLKIDGTSCSLIYDEQRLVLAKTRGDGFVGEDITQKIWAIGQIPKNIEAKGRWEIRGELYCTRSRFAVLAEEMDALGLQRPSSHRNIVAGLLGRKENVHLCRYLSFAGFQVIGEAAIFEKEEEKFAWLQKQKIPGEEVFVHQKFKGVDQAIERAKAFLKDGNYLIDGVVFTIRNVSMHERMGETAHHPRYKIAFKFQGESRPTTIESIEWSLSRNGVLTPVASVEPVDLGARITRVTLHHYGMLRQFRLKKGDVIEIVRSGEVIPKFLSVIRSSKNQFEIPSHCPSCQTALEEKDIRLICPNPGCPARNLEGLRFYVQQVGIDDLSEKRLAQLWDAGLLRSIPDLYRLSTADLIQLEKVQKKLADKLVDHIAASKTQELITFVTALGLSGGGRSRCEKIIQHGYNTLDSFRKLSVEELVRVEGMAEKSATEFFQSLEQRQDLIDELLSVGVRVKGVQGGTSLKGMKFVFTGALDRKRDDWKKIITKEGGDVSGSVSAKTDYLITNDPNSSSSKLKKAKELGIILLNEQELEKLIEENRGKS